MKISFAIPCYRSEHTVRTVCEEIIYMMGERPEYDYEIIAVNDCSPDNVMAVLRDMADKNPRIKVISFAKNCGKHAALLACFRYCSGDFIVCTDDDNQCPMDRLWDLLDPLLYSDYDVSMAQYGVKKQTHFKNFGSMLNDFIMTHLMGKPKGLQFANFTAMRKFVVDEIVRYQNPYAYVNGLILRTTNRIINVPMEERVRTVGTGGYTLRKSLRLFFNGATTFSIFPLCIALYAGSLLTVIGVLYSVYLVIHKIIYPDILLGYTSMVAFQLILNGLIMLMIGVLGEYVGRMYMCINAAPQYVIREIVNIQNSLDSSEPNNQTNPIDIDTAAVR